MTSHSVLTEDDAKLFFQTWTLSTYFLNTASQTELHQCQLLLSCFHVFFKVVIVDWNNPKIKVLYLRVRSDKDNERATKKTKTKTCKINKRTKRERKKQIHFYKVHPLHDKWRLGPWEVTLSDLSEGHNGRGFDCGGSASWHVWPYHWTVCPDELCGRSSLHRWSVRPHRTVPRNA